MISVARMSREKLWRSPKSKRGSPPPLPRDDGQAVRNVRQVEARANDQRVREPINAISAPPKKL